MYWHWLTAVWRHWLTLLSGGGVALGGVLWQQYGSQPALPTWAFLAIAFALVFQACYLAWKDNRVELMKTQTQLSVLKDNPGNYRPVLEPYLDWVVCGRTRDFKPVIALVINMHNKGLPAIAENWRTFVHRPTRVSPLSNTLFLGDKPVTFESLDGKSEISIDTSAHMLKKAVSPIGTGTSCRGVLYFDSFDDPFNTYPRVGETLEIRFKDGYQNAYMRQWVLRGKTLRLQAICQSRHERAGRSASKNVARRLFRSRATSNAPAHSQTGVGEAHTR